MAPTNAEHNPYAEVHDAAHSLAKAMWDSIYHFRHYETKDNGTVVFQVTLHGPGGETHWITIK